MKKLFVLLFLASLASIVSEAQQKVKIDKSEFQLDKPGFNIAWNNVKEGDKNYNLGGGLYPKAAEFYLEALKFNDENAALNYKLGVSSLFGNDQHGALPYFLKARSLEMEIAEDLVLLTGRAYQYRGDFAKAIDCYNLYSEEVLENGKLDPVVSEYISECKLAIEKGEKDRSILITNLGESLNCDQDDYSAVLSKDEQLVYFTTRRQSASNEKVQKTDMKFNENIFIATYGSGKWSDAGPAGSEIVTELNEGVLYVDNDNSIMLVYSGWSGNGDIFVSRFEEGQWTKPEPYLSELNSPDRETSVSVTPDGGQIFFTSDRRKGSFGGRDIYLMRHIKKNKWTKPINLGIGVNSTGNEEAVWTSKSGDTIWFSSNGREGYGGYDIFMSVRDDTGVFSEAVNMGMPTNSQYNDLFYRPSVIDSRVSWFSSDRPGGFGGLDIYKATRVPLVKLVPDTEKNHPSSRQ